MAGPRHMWGAALGLALAACGGSAERGVSDAWIRLPAVPGRPAAAYFTLHGGAAPATLRAVSTPAARRAELHQSMEGGGGMTQMAPLEQVNLPAGGTIAFAPAGRHVMLFDLSPALKAGGSTTLTFTFADGAPITVPAKLLAAGDPAPGA